jgi:hypothetical protein
MQNTGTTAEVSIFNSGIRDFISIIDRDCIFWLSAPVLLKVELYP